MKKLTRLICISAFLALCVGVFSFLRLFAEVGESQPYPDWETCAVVAADGTERPFDPLAGQPELAEGEVIRLSLVLPEERPMGYWLIFEVTGAELSLRLDGVELYRSSSPSLPGTANLSQVQLTLPEGGGESLVMELRPMEMMGLFPPLLRLTDDPTNTRETTSYGNYYALPAGASALALVLLWSLFLLGVSDGRPQWKLLLLVLAAAVMTAHPIAMGLGAYFLPEPWLSALSWPGMAVLSTLAIAAYLVLHRDRAFWKALGLAVLVSLGTLLVCTLASWLRDGPLIRFLAGLPAQLQMGIYHDLLTWLNRWLVLICILLSVWDVVRSIVRTRSRALALELKNNLVMENYRAIETKLRDSAALRHEFSHRLAALDALYQEGDMERLGRSLAEWRSQAARSARPRFTRHTAVNAILQEASARAEAAGIRFEADVSIPETLPIPHEELCSLLMNLLDNALEGAARVPDRAARYLRLRLSVRGGFLAVCCENAYPGTLRVDEKGRLLTTKEDPQAHGFGISQMTAVAERYHSILDISYTDTVFTVQTALKLPEDGQAES